MPPWVICIMHAAQRIGLGGLSAIGPLDRPQLPPATRHSQRVTSALPARYKRVTSAPPAGHHRITSMSPARHQHVTGMSPSHHQHVTSMSPAESTARHQCITSMSSARHQQIDSASPECRQHVTSVSPACHRCVTNHHLPMCHRQVDNLSPARRQHIISVTNLQGVTGKCLITMTLLVTSVSTGCQQHVTSRWHEYIFYKQCK